MQAQKNLRRAARHGDDDKERGEDSSEVSDQPKKRPASRGRGRGRNNNGRGKGRGRGKSVAMQPSTRSRAKAKRDAEDTNEDEAEECVEEHHDHEDDMESEDPPAEVNKKPSSKRAAKKAKVAPMKSQDYSTSSLTFQYLNSTPFSNSNYFMHACLQELKPSQFDLDVKAINEEIKDPSIFVPAAVIEGQKKCCS